MAKSRAGFRVIKAVLVILSVLLAETLAFAVRAEDEPSQKLQQAEAQRQTVYTQLESKLTTEQKTKLEATEKAWTKYRVLALDAFTKETEGYAYSGEEANAEFLATLVWSRLSHLNRMLAPGTLTGSDSDFRDADDTINQIYKDKRRILDRREPSESLKQAQLAWIRYRDAAAESESSLCTEPASAATRVKTELTYERALLLRPRGFRSGQRLGKAPPDLEMEYALAQLLSEDDGIRQRAIESLVAHGDGVVPLLMEQARIGLLPVHAAPIFGRLGAASIPHLLAVADDPKMGNEVLPAFLAATGPAVIPELLRRLTSDNSAASEVAAEALGMFKAQAKDAVPLLLQVAKKPGIPDPQRFAALEAALRIEPDDPEVVKAAVEGYVLRSKGDYNLSRFLQSLGPKTKRELPILAKDARDRNFEFDSLCVLEGLASPDTTELIPTLVDALVAPNTREWSLCGRALAKIGAPAVPSLLKQLHSEDTLTVQRAATVLADMNQGSHEMAQELLARATSSDTMTAVTFIDLLAKVPAAAKETVPTLLAFYRGKKPGVCSAALHALHAIAPDLDEVKRAWWPEPFVSDPYYDAGCYSQPERFVSGPHYALTADFNNDGMEDVAVSDTEFGTGGGPWKVYMKVADHKYKKTGDLEAPRSVTLFTGRMRGTGYLRICSSTSASTAYEELYKVTMDKPSCVKSVAVEWSDRDGTVPVDPDERIPVPEGCTASEIGAVPIDAAYLLGLQETAKASAGKK